MIYRVVAQSAVHEMPVVREFETKEEADDYIAIIRKEVEERRIYFKIEPKLEVQQ